MKRSKITAAAAALMFALAACSATTHLDSPATQPASAVSPAETTPLETIAGRELAALWDVAQPTHLVQVQDELLQKRVTKAEKQTVLTGRFTVAPGTELVAKVRLATTTEVKSTYAFFGLAADPTKPVREQQLEMHGAFDGAAAGFNFKPYPTISPVLDPAIRLPLEQDMAKAPAGQDHWFIVRLQVGQGWIRAWIDDRLQWERRDVDTAALRPFINIYPNARLSSIRVRSMTAAGLFEPIPLDGYVTAHQLGSGASSALDDKALPFGETATIAGVPLRFADRGATGGLDHIDLSPSLCRQGNWEDYHAANGPRFGGTPFRDPARIQLAIPNANYRNLYVVAAFDEVPGRVPILSAMFYRKGASFPMVFESKVPALSAKQADATPISVTMKNGRNANLWLVKIPLDPAMIASFSDLNVVELELTKQVFQHRSYPDPYMYGWHQGGLPSGVRVFALTLERAGVDMNIEPAQFGHVWQAGTMPRYAINLQNKAATARQVTITAQTVSHDQVEKSALQSRQISLAPGQKMPTAFDLPVKRNGIHEVTFTLADGKDSWTEKRNLCLLAKDTRAEKWTAGQGPLFGFWSYNGGHYTPSADDNIRLMAWAGARSIIHGPSNLSEATKRDYWNKHGFTQGPNAWPVHGQWTLAGDNPDPEKVKAFQAQVIENIIKAQGDNPEYVTFFPEPSISLKMTVASPQDYWGEPEYVPNEQERATMKMFWNTAKFAAEAVKQRWPNTKVLIPWGDPGFIVPFLRAGFPKNLIDGCGLDMIGFERLPEQQIKQASTHRLFILKNEFKKAGIENPMLPYVEGVFSPTEPGALTWEEQADRLHRWNLISMAYGIDRYYSSWTTFDAGSYYGTEHYAGCGIFRRIPYADPKPAYAHYATMTRMLERAKFTRWVPTGSLTTYCLEFEHPERGFTYAFWNVRGKRSAALTLEADKSVTINDAMDNATVVASKEKSVSVPVSTTPVYVYGAGKIQGIALGEPDHSDTVKWARERNQETWKTGVLARTAEPEIKKEIKIASLGDGAWKQVNETDVIYSTNNFDSHRYPGKMSVRPVADEGHGASLAVKLEAQETERKLMPFYTVVKPAKPITIPGKAAGIGLWVKAHSDWGRVIYSLRDAKGERWISIGQKDEWNCDDVHSWSAFNFDGWRLLRFELPSHLPYDNYREYGTTWWRFSGGDGVVDLPLSVEKIIVERRTHMLYVNDIQPTNGEQNDVLLGDLVVDYTSEENSTDAVVKLSKIRMPLPSSEAEMINPITAAAQNPLAATTLRAVKDPDWGYDGTRCHVLFDEVLGVKQYQVWVAAHPDGRGAQPMANMTASNQMLQGLRSQTTFYLWVTYTDADKKTSKPSNRLEIKLIDSFGMK